MWNVLDNFSVFDRAFDDVMRSALGAATTGPTAYTPAIDVRADEEKIVFHCDLPGVRLEDLSVTLDNGILTLKGERKYQPGASGEKVLLGRGYGAFTRSFSLPEGIDERGLSAELADGVLTICLLKSPKSKPRRIEIRTGNAPKQLESNPAGEVEGKKSNER
ncbi:MAG TPA: Hsp20/alpha crystallin family protein [Polyangiaceae bacterium]|nr:Hsp20/alpha crystallin family protein [Polyangiaceae bacterium]